MPPGAPAGSTPTRASAPPRAAQPPSSPRPAPRQRSSWPRTCTRPSRVYVRQRNPSSSPWRRPVKTADANNARYVSGAFASSRPISPGSNTRISRRSIRGRSPRSNFATGFAAIIPRRAAKLQHPRQHDQRPLDRPRRQLPRHRPVRPAPIPQVLDQPGHVVLRDRRDLATTQPRHDPHPERDVIRRPRPRPDVRLRGEPQLGDLGQRQARRRHRSPRRLRPGAAPRAAPSASRTLQHIKPLPDRHGRVGPIDDSSKEGSGSDSRRSASMPVSSADSSTNPRPEDRVAIQTARPFGVNPNGQATRAAPWSPGSESHQLTCAPPRDCTFPSASAASIRSIITSKRPKSSAASRSAAVTCGNASAHPRSLPPPESTPAASPVIPMHSRLLFPDAQRRASRNGRLGSPSSLKPSQAIRRFQSGAGSVFKGLQAGLERGLIPDSTGESS